MYPACGVGKFRSSYQDNNIEKFYKYNNEKVHLRNL